MKKNFIRIICLVVTLSALVAFSSCNAPKAVKFSRGTVENNVYTSEFAGLCFTTPDGWTIHSDKQIAAMYADVAEFLNNSEAFEAAAENSSMIDFSAAHPTAGDNVNISIVKGSANMKIDDIVSKSAKEIEAAYKEIGGTCSVSDPIDVTLAGKSYKCVTISVSISGVSMTQFCYFAISGKYVININCTTLSGISRDTFEKMFTAPPAKK